MQYNVCDFGGHPILSAQRHLAIRKRKREERYEFVRGRHAQRHPGVKDAALHEELVEVCVQWKHKEGERFMSLLEIRICMVNPRTWLWRRREPARYTSFDAGYTCPIRKA